MNAGHVTIATTAFSTEMAFLLPGEKWLMFPIS
jgi:hypothetical protein